MGEMVGEREGWGSKREQIFEEEESVQRGVLMATKYMSLLDVVALS